MEPIITLEEINLLSNHTDLASDISFNYRKRKYNVTEGHIETVKRIEDLLKKINKQLKFKSQNQIMLLRIRAVIKRLLGKNNEAIEDLDKLLAKEPQNETLLTMRAAIKCRFISESNINHCIQAFEEVLKIKTNNIDVQFICALLHGLKGEFKKGVEELTNIEESDKFTSLYNFVSAKRILSIYNDLNRNFQDENDLDEPIPLDREDSKSLVRIFNSTIREFLDKEIDFLKREILTNAEGTGAEVNNFLLRQNNNALTSGLIPNQGNQNVPIENDKATSDKISPHHDDVAIPASKRRRLTPENATVIARETNVYTAEASSSSSSTSIQKIQITKLFFQPSVQPKQASNFDDFNFFEKIKPQDKIASRSRAKTIEEILKAVPSSISAPEVFLNNDTGVGPLDLVIGDTLMTRSIGKWGEQYINEFLKHWYQKKYQATQITDSATGWILLGKNVKTSNEVKIEIKWLNKDTESRKPIDFVVIKTETDKAPKTRLIEVKTTTKATKLDATFSKDEVALMREHRSAYSIFSIANAGTKEVTVTKIRDPWGSIILEDKLEDIEISSLRFKSS